MAPVFTVIIPSYNRAPILGGAIASVLSQVYGRWELLLIDDGGSDDTKDVVEAFNDGRIQYIRKENGGVCSARNLGVAHAKGDYLVFLDSDDTVTENWLENFSVAIKRDLCPDIVCGGIQRIELQTQKTTFVSPTQHGKGGNGWAVVIPGAFAVKKDFILQCGLYDEVLKYAENTELFIRFELHKPVVSYTNGFDLLYYPSVDGGSKNQKNIYESAKYMLVKHKSWFATSPENKFIYLNIIAVKATLLKDTKVAFHYFLLAIAMKPFYIKTYFRLLQLIFKRH